MKRTFLLSYRALLVLVLPAALVSTSCKQDRPMSDNTRHAVEPMLANNVPFRDFDVEASNGDTITLPEGTTIYVPAGIFIDANGAPVKGTVKLHYRAFYTPGEIIASGITMLYDTAGTKEDFSSAGMFEIYGTQDNKPVSIAPGKSISMDFASTHDDADFSFYQLDTTAVNWKFLSAAKAEPNALKQQLEQTLASLMAARPVAPHEYDPQKPVIDIDVDPSDHPELSGYNGIVWQYAGSGTNPEKNPWVYATEWTSAKLLMKDTATCLYNMTLKNESKSFSTNVYPALKGENYQEALADFREKTLAFEATERDRQEKRAQAAQTADFMRKLSVAQFGIFNCDAIYRIFGKVKRIFGKFHFQNSAFDEHRDQVAIYVVTADKRVVSTYNAEGFNAFGTEGINISEGQNTCVIAVLHGEAEIISCGEFSAMINTKDGAESDFKMHSTSHKIENSGDMDDLISKL